MPFGPMNAPTFYTAMMRDFKFERDNLFLHRVSQLKRINDQSISSHPDGSVLINDVKLTAGSRSIIDNILLWCSNKAVLPLYFECVCEIFVKYRLASNFLNVISFKTGLNMLDTTFSMTVLQQLAPNST